jgi:hypothetical protein
MRRQKITLKDAQDFENTSLPYVYMEGMPVQIEADGVVKNRAHLPFLCKRCMFPLQSMQTKKLTKTGYLPVICLGTCLDALMKKEHALAELNIQPGEVFGNSWTIPDKIVAQALNYSFEGDAHATSGVDETSGVSESSESSS